MTHANSSAARMGRRVVTVVPVTSNVERVHPFQVLLRAGAGWLPHDSKAEAEAPRMSAGLAKGKRTAE